MNDRDITLVTYIKKHYDELKDELEIIHDSFEEYMDNKLVRKAIRMDALQIGEHFNHLSNDTLKRLNKFDIKGIIDIRNFLVHGYVIINEQIMWQTIHEDIPRLISELFKLMD